MKKDSIFKVCERFGGYGIEHLVITALYSADLEALQRHSSSSAAHFLFVERFLSLLMVQEVKVVQHAGARTRWRQLKMRIRVEIGDIDSKMIVEGLLKSWGQF